MLTRPLYPDEWINGYRGHLIYLNNGGWAMYRHLMKSINSVGPRTGCLELEGRRVKSLTQSGEVSLASQLKQKSGADRRAIALLHSLAPLHLLMEGKRRALFWGEDGHIRFAPKGFELFMPARQKAYICADCAKEDIGFWGASYWRRSHQIPGTNFCGKHDKILRQVPMNYVDRLPPDRVLDVSEEVPGSEGVGENQTIRKYVELTHMIFDEGLTLHFETTWGLLIGEIRRRGLDLPHHRLYFKQMLECIAKEVPSAWFDDLPSQGPEDASTPGRGRSIFMSDSKGKRHPQAYLLIAAWIFDCASEALKAIHPLKIRSLYSRIETPDRSLQDVF